jgi:glutamate--cysteine ligase
VNAELAGWFDWRRDEIHRRSFQPSDDGRRVGVEAELLVYDDETNAPLPLVGERRSLVALLRQSSARLGWNEAPGYGDVSKFEIPGGAVVSFEPGGQLEISSAVHTGGSTAALALQEIVQQLRDVLGCDGVRLDSMGIDPFNDARSIPQQLPAERYRRMTEYFESIGPFGIRMMRQTAAIQVSVDRGGEPAQRWQLLNDLAPYVTAIFANSPRYLGQETGHRSYRAHCWRMLDVTRTGMLPHEGDPAASYMRFALGARDMLRTDAGGEYRAFGEWERGPDADARWDTHLTTLFPEVRPRGHFEVRSCDAIDPEWYVVPILLICGLAYDDRSANEAAVLAGDSAALLRGAGEHALRDPSIARTARDLFQLALQGAARLGAAYFSEEDVERCRAYYDRYTARDRSPADDRQPEREARLSDRSADRSDPSLRSG